ATGFPASISTFIAVVSTATVCSLPLNQAFPPAPGIAADRLLSSLAASYGTTASNGCPHLPRAAWAEANDVPRFVLRSVLLQPQYSASSDKSSTSSRGFARFTS